MTDINFTSTYRIPISQAGVNAAKKAKLKELIQSYPNGLIGSSKVGNARISVPDSEDANFIAKLKTIGYKVYQKFEGDNLPKGKIDAFIRENLTARTYAQKGKSPERLSRKIREQRRYERSLTKAEEPPVENVSDVKPPVVKKEPVKKQIEIPEQTIGVFGDMTFTEQEKAFIRESSCYRQLVKEKGKEYAEAVYFGQK